LCVGCGGCVMVVWWVEEEFSNTLRQDLTLLSPIGYSIDASGQTGCAP
jgi:hypothetical protein